MAYHSQVAEAAWQALCCIALQDSFYFCFVPQQDFLPKMWAVCPAYVEVCCQILTISNSSSLPSLLLALKADIWAD